MVAAFNVLANCSWKANLGLPDQISPTDELVRANGTVLLDCGVDDVTFRLSVASPVANNGGFSTNLVGITAKYQVNNNSINEIEREFDSGQAYPLEVLIEQKEGNVQGGQLQLPPLRVCYTEPNAAGLQCKEQYFTTSLTVKKLSCELPSVTMVPLGVIYTHELPSHEVRFNLPEKNCIADNVKNISFGAIGDNNVISISAASSAKNIGIELLSGNNVISLNQDYAASDIVSKSLAARVVRKGGIPSAGEFNAVVTINLTYF
ncbi:hypothetical protein BOO93_03205 [Vibrio navarrensis]|nr:hypothetical protein [Vibrio navarrensis]